MEWNFPIEKVDDETIKIVSDNFNLSPWLYSVRLGRKWHNVFIDGPVIKFNRSISYYFKEIENQQLEYDINENKFHPSCSISLDLFEYKKLQKIDRINPGSAITPVIPVDDERMNNLEKELNQKQKQILLLSSKLDNLEILLKRSLGL